MQLRSTSAATLAALALASLPALAVDGVILIDQNKALAGNVTAGDAAGYPITINTPGSYRLSGKLTVPSGSDGIVIAADGVTIDLNGFTLSSQPGSVAVGIHDLNQAHSRIAIRNGSVTGFNSSIRLYESAHVAVDDVMLDPGAAGIALVVGQHSRVSRNTVVGNGLIQVSCPSILTENQTEGFVTVFVVEAGKQCIRYHNRYIGSLGAINE